jgi:ergothioneine biosynthesis protein EgtB
MKGNNYLLNLYRSNRQNTLAICEKLEIEDYAIQPSSFVSPPKWHLAHTTWFFEELFLKKVLDKYNVYNMDYSFIFNSYYNSLGEFIPQPKRGILSRPTTKEIIKYREYIDVMMSDIIGGKTLNDEEKSLIELGIHHEQQHQELLYMDIKYILNSGNIVYDKSALLKAQSAEGKWELFEENTRDIGANVGEFSYDNENPRHKIYMYPFLMRNTLVSNGEYLDFINAKSYDDHKYWLSMGWDYIKRNNIKHPLYWKYYDKKWYEYTLNGLQELDLNAPVVHINYFEANAFASFQHARLPTESEMETFLCAQPTCEQASFSKNHPFDIAQPKRQVWCWTSSSYAAYPGYKALGGPLFEYNKKFMCNQYVLRGGAVVTPHSHYRDSYRNFYLPSQRWMFSGIRLAKDLP